MEKTCTWFVDFFVEKIEVYQIFIKENSSVPINKDDKQLTPNYNSQQSQETNSNPGKTIERQASQPASSSYTASQTHDEVR